MTGKIEHVAFLVEDPVAVATWYGEHLGFSVVKEKPKPDETETRFLADAEGRSVVEIYRNEAAQVPDYAALHPLVLHLALVSDDPAGDRDRLVAAGATMVEDVTTTPAGDELVMLRDPWGLALQLCKRKQAI